MHARMQHVPHRYGVTVQHSRCRMAIGLRWKGEAMAPTITFTLRPRHALYAAAAVLAVFVGALALQIATDPIKGPRFIYAMEQVLQGNGWPYPAYEP